MTETDDKVAALQKKARSLWVPIAMQYIPIAILSYIFLWSLGRYGFEKTAIGLLGLIYWNLSKGPKP